MIQLVLEFQLEKPELPVEYERTIVSFLKAASNNYSQEMFERLYDKSKSIIKTFTYSVYLPGVVFDKDVIKLKETRFKIFFTDADMGQTIEWFNSILLWMKREQNIMPVKLIINYISVYIVKDKSRVNVY